MMHPDMSLQIVWPRILVFSIRTEGADVAGGVVDEAVTYHFVFALEPFAAFRAGAATHGAVMRPVLRVDIRMGAKGVLVEAGNNTKGQVDVKR
jgi:hypothetical protein